MSKKLEAIKKAVFYSQQKPEMLAKILEGAVSDVATSIEISGADSIKIPLSSNVTQDYSATVISQFGDKMTGSATFALDSAVTGVSVSGNTVTVASTCTADSFTLKATSGSITVKKTVELVTRVATSITISGASSITIPDSDSTTSDYTSKVYDQFGDEMSGVSATLALNEAVTGVSVSNGTVTVASTCTADGFVLKATSGEASATKEVALTAGE